MLQALLQAKAQSDHQRGIKDHHKVEEQGRKVQQQEATISQVKSTSAELKSAAARQQDKTKALTATLKEQALQIQKASAKLEPNRPAPLSVANNQ